MGSHATSPRLSVSMIEIFSQLALVAALLATLFVGPGIAVIFLIIRKKRRRSRGRSPIGIDLLRTPGHTLREKLEEASGELTWDIVILCLIPMMALATFLAQAHLTGLTRMVHLAPVYVVAVLGFIAWMVRKLLKAGEHLDNLRAGYDAELAVGQELDQLMRAGAVVFHDFPADGFNIDHVVIAREGVFAVETKGFTKPGDKKGRASATVAFDGHLLKFPSWTTSEPLEQAERQAKWLSKWATSAVGGMVIATPVLALPGWFVERTGKSVVRVYSGKALASLLKMPSSQLLTSEDVQRIAHQVEQRCRTVVPTYRRTT